MAAFNGPAFGAAVGHIDEEIQTKINVISVGFVSNGGSFPITRLDGSALQKGDYVLPSSGSSFPMYVEGKAFMNNTYRGIYLGGSSWETRGQGLQNTSETTVANPTNESYSGTKTLQSEINIENKEEFDKRELKSNKFNSFDDLPDGDLTKYPSGHAVRELNKKNIPSTRKVANYTLENDITIQQLIDAIKDVARVYKNVTFDCDDNTLRNIIVASCFKAGEVLSSMPATMTTEEYKLLTAKAIYDFVIARVQGAITLKGSKRTLSEITCLIDMENGDEWYCVETGRFYLYTIDSDWTDVGGGVDVSAFITKADIINNLTTNDSQKTLSAAQGKVLKDLVDTKQDKIEVVEKGNEVATLNPTVNFVNRKLNFFMGMTLVNIEASPSSPVVNWTSERKEILRLPVPPQNYSYPSKMDINVSRPSGQWSCEENRHEFYDTDGDHYVNPTIGVNVSMRCTSVVEVGSDTSPVYDKNGNIIHIAIWLKNVQNHLIVKQDGTPFVNTQTVDVLQTPTTELPNPKVYVLKYTKGQGYTYVNKYYTNNDGTGEVTGDFYELIEVPITFNTEYMYKCFLMNYQKRMVGENFVVDNQGRLCTYKIIESEASKIVNAKPANTVFSDFEGFDGTITITPIEHNATIDRTIATVEAHTAPDPEDPTKTIIDYYSMHIHGSNTYTDVTMNKSY